MKTQGKTILHVHIIADGKDHYFGSIAAIYTKLTAKQLKVSRSRLYDFDIEEDRPYSNKVCIIKKSELHRKPGNRKKDKVTTKKVITCS